MIRTSSHDFSEGASPRNPGEEMTRQNENCLEGFRCPKCDSTDMFDIVGEALFTVTDDGTTDFTDVEWGPDSACVCRRCQEKGKVRDFQAIETKIKLTKEVYEQITSGARSYLVRTKGDYRVRDRIILKETTPDLGPGKKIVEKETGNSEVFLISHIDKSRLASKGTGGQWIISLVPWDGMANQW